MAINPHMSDQLATEARNARHRPTCAVPPSVPPLIERLLGQLPGVDRRLLGEILLHAADVGYDLEAQMIRRGHSAEVIAHSVLATLSAAGTQLYTGQVS